MTKRLGSGTLVALVVTAAVVGTFAGAAVAASDGSLNARPATPGATATHTATLTVGENEAGSWNGFSIDYSNTSASVDGVGEDDLAVVGIDRGDDSSGAGVDVRVADDVSGVSTSNNGKTLTVSLGGSYSVNAGDEVVVRVANVTNPSETGTYQVPLDYNPQSSGGEVTATLSVSEDSDTTQSTETTQSGDTTPSTETTTTQDTTQAGGDTTTSGTTADTGTTESGGTPGFTALAGLVGTLAAALVAARRVD